MIMSFHISTLYALPSNKGEVATQRILIEHEYCQGDSVLYAPRDNVPTSNNGSELTQIEVSTNPHLQRILLEHDYCKTAVSQCRLPSTITDILPQPHASQKVKSAAPDGVLDYATAVLNDGLLFLEFKDAIREGDGPRILHVWKVLMLYFLHAGHKNYRLEAFHLQSMVHVNATASPKVAA